MSRTVEVYTEKGREEWVWLYNRECADHLAIPREELSAVIADLQAKQNEAPGEGDRLVRVTANTHWVCVDIDGQRVVDIERRDLWRVIRALKAEWEARTPATRAGELNKKTQ